MAESNPTQVILTDDGLKIIKAQNTADEAAGNINDINSDNKLTPSEKLKLKQEYDKDVELYNIDIKQLKSVDLPTAKLETAMSNLTDFVTPLFKEMNRTSTVDRNALDNVFTVFAAADKNASQAFVNMVQQVADDAKKAGDDAKEVGTKAQEAGEAAKASATQAQVDATQAKADAATAQQKAQSSIDQLNEHLPDIDEALSTANLVKQSVTKLSDTTEQYHNEYTTGIQNVVKTIDGITIGGTNLVPNSGYPTSTEHWIAGGGAKNVFRVTKHAFYHNGTDNTFNLINQGAKADLECYVSSERFPVKPNTQYSLSFKGFASNNVPSMDVFFLGRKYNSTASIGYDKAILIVNKKVLSPSQVDTVQAVFNTGDCEEGYLRFDNNGSLDGKDSSLYFTEIKVEQGNKATDWSLSPFDTATSTEIDQINNAIKLKANSSDVTSQINVATQGIQTDVTNKVSGLSTKINQTASAVQILSTNAVTQSDITASINNIHLGVKNADGSTSTFNMNSDTILLDANKIIFNGNTSIQNGTIGTAKIANAAINTAQIADGAINNAKIANASIDDAKINSLNGNKLVENSITANKINVDDLIANGINTKTLTSVNLNTSTLTTPQLDLGLNGTFTEDFDYTQSNLIFLPKKNKGTLTFNHGVLQSEGKMQTYVGGQWGGMNDNYTFQAGIDNSQWTEVAPGYIKLDLFKQNDTDIAERTYVDPTGFYYTTAGNQTYTSYVGNVVSTPQVQTASVVADTIDIFGNKKTLEIGHSGSDIGLQVGSYDGGQAVLSDFIYNTAYSSSPNVYITPNGRLVRGTSASKYKYNIKNPDIETTLGDRLLNVHMATWNDKNAVDSYAEELSTGEKREKISIDKCYGLVAEQLRNAGLDMFITYGKNHEIEGVQYDRAWIPLLSVIRRLNDKVNEYELRLSKLEGVSK
ncbi:hypothetical protein GBO93_07015 [Pediococcus acidilactici]|uniref:hypothetical protein n=1 Tax=Pediococcus acidilactici TaxID=1254 RepID=UPI00132F7E8D|nr:hypothetical protein [Pediococcus acidilactici]KAF0446393.1 hypothetical protein GBO93_07015 [Pediococcus acidilactici]KAF0478001.1 hypothetical protein GBP11_07975 [Pediococcus acidilactici]